MQFLPNAVFSQNQVLFKKFLLNLLANMPEASTFLFAQIYSFAEQLFSSFYITWDV